MALAIVLLSATPTTGTLPAGAQTPTPAAQTPTPAPAGSPTSKWTAEVSGTTATLRAVSFPDPAHGWAVGDAGTIVATTDGGQTWTRQFACAGASPCPPSRRVTTNLTGVSFPDADHGFAVGNSGTVLSTTDAGHTWAVVRLCVRQSPCTSVDGAAANLTGVSFPDAAHGWVVGDASTILATGDGGRTWAAQHACATAKIDACSGDLHADLHAVDFVNDQQGWTAGSDGQVNFTSDGGTTWQGDRMLLTDLGFGHYITPDLRAISLVAPGREGEELATLHGVGPAGVIVQTDLLQVGWERFTGNDGHWFSLDPSPTAAGLNGVWFSDKDHGWAVGEGGAVLSTTTGGSTWVLQASGTDRNLLAVDFPNANTGYAVGEDGTIVTLRIPPPPGLTVTAVTPNRGPTSGQFTVLISGHGFSDVTEVNFGTAFAYGFTVDSDTTITAVLPEYRAGTSDVTVTSAAGVSGATAADEFTFIPPTGGTWRPAGSCSNPCSGPAVRLPDGRVLVEGTGDSGTGETVASDAAQLYDPATGTWGSTSIMHYARRDHTATLLDNGQVLVAGGVDETGAGLTSAELYDPATGAWSVTGSMVHALGGGQTATLLTNGRVLVLGGADAETYDPGTGTWTATAPLPLPTDSADTLVAGMTATLLKDGRVLVIGNDGHATTTAAWLYDPRNGTWLVTGSLNQRRRSFTATLLADGKVLVVGGEFDNEDRPTTTIPYAELYDPATGIWTPTGPMVLPRAEHTATLLASGKVLVTGGIEDGDYCPCGEVAYAELYDPTTGGWDLASGMLVPRDSHHATLLKNGDVLVTGGEDKSGSDITAAEVFAPSKAALLLDRRTRRSPGRSIALAIGGLALLAGGLVFGLSRRKRSQKPLFG